MPQCSLTMLMLSGRNIDIFSSLHYFVQVRNEWEMKTGHSAQPTGVDWRWPHNLCHWEVMAVSLLMVLGWPWDLSWPIECAGSATVNLPMVASCVVQVCLHLLKHCLLGASFHGKSLTTQRARPYAEGLGPSWMLQPQPRFLLNVTPCAAPTNATHWAEPPSPSLPAFLIQRSMGT